MNDEYEKVQRYLRPGAWITPHDWLLKTARRQLVQLENDNKNFNDRLNESIRNSTDKDEERSGFMHENCEEHNRIESLSLSTELYCYLAIEAFINLYGVKRLGQKIYDDYYRHITRIDRKLFVLIATCNNILLPTDHELLKLSKKLFLRRNKIAHPKSREWDPTRIDLDLIEDPLKWPRIAIGGVSEFYRLFEKIDPDISVDLSYTA